MKYVQRLALVLLVGLVAGCSGAVGGGCQHIVLRGDYDSAPHCAD